jgi:hypothetical protein
VIFSRHARTSEASSDDSTTGTERMCLVGRIIAATLGRSGSRGRRYGASNRGHVPQALRLILEAFDPTARGTPACP